MNEARAPLRRRLRATALDLATSGARFIPLPAQRALLHGAAWAAAYTKFERTTLANLERALGSEADRRERLRIARGVRQHGARLALEWLRLARARGGGRSRAKVEAWIDATVEFDSSCAAMFEAARSERGVLIATAHIGNWELLAAALRRRGLDGAVVGLRKHRDPSADWLVATRAALGVRTIAQDAPAREVLGVLRSGAVLGILCDLEVRRLAGLFVPFFGIPALTMRAPASLARAARADLHPLRCVRRGSRYVVLADAPMTLTTGVERGEAERRFLTALNATFERWIREDPEQWAWHQPRWRTRPGERAAPPLHSPRSARDQSG